MSHTHKVNSSLDEANRKVSFRIQPMYVLECCFFEIDACTVRNCWSIQMGFVSTKNCSTTWCESSLWTRSAYRYSSQIPLIVVHLIEHVKKQYGKKFAMKERYLSVNCSTSAFLIVWQKSVRYEFHKPQTLYGNFLVQWNLLQLRIFSWKPVWVPDGLPTTWGFQGPRFEGRVKNVHIPGLPGFWSFPAFWEKQMLCHMEHSFGNTIFQLFMFTILFLPGLL